MSGCKLKIAFIHQPWSIVDPRGAPADSVVLVTRQLARRLARSCEVVCYSRWGGGLPRIEQVDGVEHRRIHGPLDRYVKFAMGKLDQWGLRDATRPFFASRLAYRQFIRRAADDLRSLKPDVVHIQNFSQFVPVARAALPDAVIVLQMHCEWLTQLDRDTVAARIGDADLIIGVSEFLAGKIRRRFGEHARRIVHVHNGADLDLFTPGRPRADRSSRAVLYVGRVSPEKGIHTLLDAFAIVAKKAADVHLHIVGPQRVVPYEMIVPFCDDPRVREMSAWYRPGAYAAHLRMLLNALPADRVRWTDREVRQDQLPHFYRDADVFVFPSVWEEPFGMPLVEAMACGCPAIATRSGAFGEIIVDGVTGVLVQRADASALAEGILRLCSDESLRRRMAEGAVLRAREHFSWERSVAILLDRYRRVQSMRQQRGA